MAATTKKKARSVTGADGVVREIISDHPSSMRRGLYSFLQCAGILVEVGILSSAALIGHWQIAIKKSGYAVDDDGSKRRRKWFTRIGYSRELRQLR